jgi:hypothetical protein
MTTMSTPEETAPPADGPSLLGRTLRVFVRPFRAWDGLEHRTQWWFPMLLGAVVAFVLAVTTYDKVMTRAVLDSLQPKIESGQVTQEAADRIVSSPVTKAINITVVTLTAVIAPLVIALGLWFAVGFVLGRPFGYRLALEVASWSGLVAIPATIVKFALAAWQDVSVNFVHLGLGAVIPLSDPPEKLQQSLAVLLDVIGPFSIWLLVVQVAGCAALSGAPRKNVAWALSGLFVVVTILAAVTTFLFMPES